MSDQNEQQAGGAKCADELRVIYCNRAGRIIAEDDHGNSLIGDVEVKTGVEELLGNIVKRVSGPGNLWYVDCYDRPVIVSNVSNISNVTGNQPPSPLDRIERLERQVKRMEHAQDQQTAKFDSMTDSLHRHFREVSRCLSNLDDPSVKIDDVAAELYDLKTALDTMVQYVDRKFNEAQQLRSF